MRRIGFVIVLGVLIASALTIGAASSLGNSDRASKSGSITIQSWLHANPAGTGLAGTVTACFKLQGTFADLGGKPTWTNASYDSTAASLDTKCRDWWPVGGFNFVPPVAGEDFTLYAVHTITGEHGQLYITFAGSYNLVSTMQGSGTWVITGGTGSYEGVRGQGTWEADASHFPYIRHTEIGTLSR